MTTPNTQQGGREDNEIVAPEGAPERDRAVDSQARGADARTIADVQHDPAKAMSDQRDARETWEARDAELRRKIAMLKDDRALAMNGCSPEETALAQSVLETEGPASESAGGAFDAALTAISRGGESLRSSDICAERYDGVHRRCDREDV